MTDDGRWMADDGRRMTDMGIRTRRRPIRQDYAAAKDAERKKKIEDPSLPRQAK